MLLAALVVLVLAGVGLWALERHRSEDNPSVAAPATNGSDEGALTDSARIVSLSMLPDPSWGWWPISGDFFPEGLPGPQGSGAQKAGQQDNLAQPLIDATRDNDDGVVKRAVPRAAP